MLTQHGHIDEQLKEQLQEQLKSQKEESRKCRLKMIQSISYLSRQGIALCKEKQDEESSFKQHLLRAEDDELLQKWIKKSYHSCCKTKRETNI